MDRLEAMRVFCKVVEHGSFSGAADRLDQSASAVSRWVAQLETHLQIRLLNRTTRRISLTESGRAYYERARLVLSELEELELAVSEHAAEPRGILKISTSADLGQRQLAPALAACQTQYPQLQFNISISGRKVDLVEEGFDLALRIGSPDTLNAVARQIGKTHMLYVASPEYLKRAPPLRTPADLCRHPCITYEHGLSVGAWHFTDAQGNDHTVQVEGGLHTDNGEFIVAAAANGLGVGRGLCFTVVPYIQEGRLARILADYQAETLPIYAVYPSRKHLSAKVRTFIHFFETWLSQRGLAK